MTARAAVQQLLATDALLTTIGVQLVLGANAADTEDVSDVACFAVIRWEDTTQAFGHRGSSTLTVWVHDKDRDYGRIQNALQRVKELLADAVHLAGVDGWTLTLADWRGDSGDLYDDGYGTITRYSTFSTASRQTLG